jgi:hypothetical protein
MPDRAGSIAAPSILHLHQTLLHTLDDGRHFAVEGG